MRQSTKFTYPQYIKKFIFHQLLKAEQERGRDRYIPSTGLLPKSLQYLRLDQENASNLKLHLGLPHLWWGSKYSNHHPLPPRMHQQEDGSEAGSLDSITHIWDVGIAAAPHIPPSSLLTLILGQEDASRLPPQLIRHDFIRASLPSCMTKCYRLIFYNFCVSQKSITTKGLMESFDQWYSNTFYRFYISLLQDRNNILLSYLQKSC